MLNRDLSTHSGHAVHRDVIASDDACTVGDQTCLLNNSFLLPPEVESLERRANNLDSFIEFLDAYRQRLQVNAEVMRELYHRRQGLMTEPSLPVLPIQDNNPTELEKMKGELGAFQYHSINMDTLRSADAHCESETSMYSPGTESVHHQTWGFLRSAQTSILHGGRETLPWQGVMSEYEKITSFPPVYAPYSQLATSEYYSSAPELDLDGVNLCLPQQLTSPNIFIDTVKDGNGDAQSTLADASRGGEVSEPSVVSFIFGGTKHYRCKCGFQSPCKGRMDRHRDSLQHSERRYRCSCGKPFTRVDSLKRHKKRCNQRC